MEQIGNRILLHYTNSEINGILKNLPSEPTLPFTTHFSQSEEMFIQLQEPLMVKPIALHHDVHKKEPNQTYLLWFREIIDQLKHLVPHIFSGLTYFFDPTEILRPSFFQAFKVKERLYLYMLHLDLTYRPQWYETISKGTNDTLPHYNSKRIFIDAEIVPLQTMEVENGRIKAFILDQVVDDTWIGETGRGYFVQGIWLDRDLTKFFSKLFIPKGHRTYPYYPFSCKYRSVCHPLVDLSPSGRRKRVPMLHRARDFLGSHIREIEQELRHQEFSESMELFTRLRGQVPPELIEEWKSISLEVYLNEMEMREYKILSA